MEEDFQIDMTEKLESEVSLMCNLSKGVEERGIEKGIKKGIEKGKIYGAILICKDINMQEDEILQKLQTKFKITEEEAKKYLKETNG